jgi:hypothetical protein
MKAKRQLGGRYVAWMRGAFRGSQARLRQPVDQPNPEPDGATGAPGASTVADLPRQTQRAGKSWDLTLGKRPAVA